MNDVPGVDDLRELIWEGDRLEVQDKEAGAFDTKAFGDWCEKCDGFCSRLTPTFPFPWHSTKKDPRNLDNCLINLKEIETELMRGNLKWR